MSKTAFRIIGAALLPFSLLQIVARRSPQFHPDLMDGLRGLLLGIVIGMLILMSRQKGMRLRAKACNSGILVRYR
ncbi:MAG TPA: hypothetical protein VGP87_13990 [Gemmatimonadales bacterium]|nr:hypothetical protein [Gemmatimonadales bacterium]